MKKLLPLLTLLALLFHPRPGMCQQGNGNNVFDKANNAVNKISNAIAVFQPYLLKARQIYYDAKQTASDFKRDAKGVFHKDSTNNAGYGNSGYGSNGGNNSSGGYNSNSGYNGNGSNGGYSSSSGNGTNGATNSYNGNGSNSGYGGSSANGSNSGYGGTYQNGSSGNAAPYLQGQSLPVNNPSSVNDDATGNWGNQNNGLYGNCLDVLTGTVMGMGEAAQSPGSVDLLFFAPSDGQNTYTLMTPGFARNDGSAGAMTEGVSEQVKQWSDINESEVALTKITIGQFNQIQNNSQIQNAARNAQDYAGWYSSVAQKLDGRVFAVRVSMENRDVYALVAVIRQIGTSGNNGYLKIKIKSTGLDANHDGQVDANVYLRK